jgi:hypothetical protein
MPAREICTNTPDPQQQSAAVAAAIGAGGTAVASTTAHADLTTCAPVSGSGVTGGYVLECGDGGDGLDYSAEQGAGAHEHPKSHCPTGELLGSNGSCFRPPPN